MKKFSLLMSESRTKRLLWAMLRNQAEFLNALGGNSQLYQWLKANQPYPYFQNRFDLYADLQSKQF